MEQYLRVATIKKKPFSSEVFFFNFSLENILEQTNTHKKNKIIFHFIIYSFSTYFYRDGLSSCSL